MIAVGPQVATVMTPQALRHRHTGRQHASGSLRRTGAKVLLPISAASSPAQGSGQTASNNTASVYYSSVNGSESDTAYDSSVGGGSGQTAVGFDQNIN